MKILITGGTGYLGAWLCRFLNGKSMEITVLCRSKPEFMASSEFQYIECDLTDFEQCKKKLFNVDFEVVLHTASANDFFEENYHQKALIVNALGTRNLLECIRHKKDTRLIYFSTFHVYGTSTGCINEDHFTDPRNDYASTHLFAEQYIRQFHHSCGLAYTILRLTNGYGAPVSKSSSKWYLLLNDLARMAIEEKKIVLKTNGIVRRDFIWLGDVCHAIYQLLHLPAEKTLGVFNLSSQQTFSTLDVAKEVRNAYLEVFGLHLEIEVSSKAPESYTEALTVDSSKLRNLIDLKTDNHLREEVKQIFALLT